MRSRRSGQALVVGVTVMFILLAVGLLFLRQALVHLNSTNVSNERTDDLNLSRAGIDFIDHELMTSPLGADWRPVPRNLNPGFLVGGTRDYLQGPDGNTLPKDPPLAALDPDFQYLRPWAPVNAPEEPIGVYKGLPFSRSPAGPSGGFTRLNFGKGRVLVRVSYNPRNAILFNGVGVGIPVTPDLPPVIMESAVQYPAAANWAGQYWTNYLQPPAAPYQNALITRGPWTEIGPTPISQYLRIEAIGRFGDTQQIDNTVPSYTDPTLLENAGLNRPYRVSLVAYKAFGLGDHLLFVTNNNKETGPFDIGFSRALAPPPVPPATEPAPTFTYFDETPGGVPGDLGNQFLSGDLRINGDARFFNVVGLDDSMDAHQPDPNPPVNPGAGGPYPDPFIPPPAPAQPFPPFRPVFGGVNVGGQISDGGPAGSLFLSDYNRFWQSRVSSSTPAGELFVDNLVRDNAWFNNPGASAARSIRRLTAPATDLDRFRLLAPAGPAPGLLAANLGGPGLLINNTSDMQPAIADNDVHDQDERDFAPQSWFSPYDPPASDKTSWPNPGYIYSPPSVHMVFHHPVLAPSTDPDPLHYRHYYIRIFTANGSWPWFDHTSSNSSYLDVYYTPDALSDRDVITAAATVGRSVTDPGSGRQVPAPVAIVRNNTILAEGNLTVHGDVAPGMVSSWPAGPGGAQITIVSRGTIYLDGSLSRAEQGTGTPQDINKYQTYVNGAMQAMGTLEIPSAAVLIAQDNVAVNLSAAAGTRVQHWNYQFGPELQPDDDIPTDYPDLNVNPGDPPAANHWVFDFNGGQGTTPRYFRYTFSLAGVPPGQQVRLYLRHASKLVNGPPGQNTEVDAYLNPYLTPGRTAPSVEPIYLDGNWASTRILKANSGNLPPEQQSITPLVMSVDGQSSWEYASYVLDPNRLIYGGQNEIDVEVPSGTYYLSRIQVAAGPVEGQANLEGAFIASQGGFYIIPKDWWFFGPSDTGVPQRRHPDLPMTTPVDYSSFNGSGWGTDNNYPGYGSPSAHPSLEQIIVDGSLTVNKMAPQADQAQWTRYDPAPVAMGDNSLFVRELRFVYPYYNPPAGTVLTTTGPLYAYNDSLQDLTFRDGLWLPMMPRMSMSPGLAYEGEGQVL